MADKEADVPAEPNMQAEVVAAGVAPVAIVAEEAISEAGSNGGGGGVAVAGGDEEEASIFQERSDAQAEIMTRTIFADGVKHGEDTSCFKVILPAMDPPVGPGTLLKNIDGLGYDVMIPKSATWAKAGEEFYLRIPKASGASAGKSEFDINLLDEEDDDRFKEDSALPGADSTMGNYVMRKLTKTVRFLTFGLVKNAPGFLDLGEKDPESHEYLEDKEPWAVDETHPRPHLSFKRAKLVRNQQSCRRKVLQTEYAKELKQVESHKAGCAGCKELDFVDKEHIPENITAMVGEYRPHPFETPIPYYKFPGLKMFCPKQWQDQSSPVDECGIGVSGYFKMVKSLAVIFGLMSIITAPQLILFSQSTAVPDREQFYSAIVDSQKVLATSTISNLAEPIPQCHEAVEGQTLKFRCPPNYYITSIVAYYGQPKGACGCPYPQQVSSQSSECYGKQEYPVDATTGVKATDPECAELTTGENAGNVMACFPGIDRFGNRCCSYDYADRNTLAGDFSDLTLAPTVGCNSLTAPFIANALCANKNFCEIAVGESQAYTFDTSKILSVGAGTDPKNICTSITGTTCTTYLRGSSTTSLNGNALFDSSSCDSNIYSYGTLAAPQQNYEDYRFMLEAVCQIDSVTIGTRQGSITLTDEYIVEVATNLNAIAILVFIFGVLWIQRKVEHSANVGEKENCTASDYTILVHTLPKEAKTKEEIVAGLKEFFKTQLHDPDDPIDVDIADINVTTGEYNYLDSLVERGAASMAIDEVIGSIQSLERRGLWWEEKEVDGTTKKVRKSSTAAYVKKLSSVLLRFEIANDNVQTLSDSAACSLSKAYVTFNNEKGMARAVSKYPYIGTLLTSLTQSTESKMDGQTVFLERAPEPEEIIYENVSVPGWNRAIRFCMSTWITLLCLAVSYAMIYEAKNASTMWSGYHPKVQCSTFEVIVSKDASVYANAPSSTITYQDVLFDYDPTYYGVNSTEPYDSNGDYAPSMAKLLNGWGNYNYLQCYCSQVAFDAKNAGSQDPMKDMKAYLFYDKRSGKNLPYCDMMLSGSTIGMAANYIATFVIVLVNAFLAFVMNSMVSFEKHAHATGRIMSMMIKLFIAQYINTAFLSLIIAGDISKAGGTNIRFSTPSDYVTFGIFTGTIQDYDVTWYATVGSSILFTMFMFTIGNQPTVLIDLVMKEFTRLWDRRWKFHPSVTHVDTQEALNKLYVGPEIEMNMKYAALCTLIFVDLTYSATMPLFNIVTFLNLVVMYSSDKYMMYHLFKKPPVLNADLPRCVCKMLYFAAMIHVANGMWMFGNNAFYDPTVLTYFSTFTQSGVLALTVTHTWYEPIVALDRAVGLYSVFLLAILCLLGLLFGLYILDDVFMDMLGGKTILMFLQKKCRKNPKDPHSVPFFLKWVPAEESIDEMIENNPTYFEAIDPDSVEARLAEGDLDVELTEKYRMLKSQYKLRVREVESETLHPDVVKEKLAHLRLQEAAMTRFVHKEKGDLVENINVGGEETSIQAPITVAPVVDTVKRGCFGEKTATNGCKEGTDCAPGGKCDCFSWAMTSCYEEVEKHSVPYSYSLGETSFEYRCMKGHESYNMNTVPSYSKKFGFDSEHMDRYFSLELDSLFGAHFPHPNADSDPTPGAWARKDWVIERKTFRNPSNDNEAIRDLIRECLPRRVKKTLKEKYRDPADGKLKTREVERLVIPWQFPLLDAYFGLCGGVKCANGKKGLECLSEPTPEGEQPKWQSPCGKSGDSKEPPTLPAARAEIGNDVSVSVSSSDLNPAAETPQVEMTKASSVVTTTTDDGEPKGDAAL